jgi:phosphatidylglycerol:prolipoprotein diacylglycerol transferase
MSLLLRCYPKITDWLYEVSNIDLRFLPIYSYGFFVACGFLVAAWLAAKEMQRREAVGLMGYKEKKVTTGLPPNLIEIAGFALIGFFVGLKIGGIIEDKTAFANNPQSYIFSLQGNIIAGIIGAVALAGYQYYMAKKQQLPEPKVETVKMYASDQVGDLVVIAAILGVIGANFFNYLENPEDYTNFMQDPIGSLFSGLSVLGGLIFAGIGFGIYAYVKKISVLLLFDSVAPTYILANGIGRLGCHVSGDGDWGIVNTLDKPGFIPEFLWRNNYAHNIINEGVPIPGCIGEHCNQLIPAVFPTPLYELAMCTAICLILLALRNRFMYKPGIIFLLFVAMNGIQRFTIEQVRDVSGRNLTSIFGFHLKQAEIISLVMFVAGTIGFLVVNNMYNKKKISSKQG